MYLPTVHGFDEFLATSITSMPCRILTGSITRRNWIDKTGPRDLIHRLAKKDDPTVLPRWGKVQESRRIVDVKAPCSFPNMVAGRGGKKAARQSTTWRLSTRCWSATARDSWIKPKRDATPSLSATTRMHVFTYISLEVPGDDDIPRTTTGWRRPAWPSWAMTDVGANPTASGRYRRGREHHRIFTSDNGAEVFTWPGRRACTPFKSTKGTVISKVAPRAGRSSVGPDTLSPAQLRTNLSGLDWFPTLVLLQAILTSPIGLLKGCRLATAMYKNHWMATTRWTFCWVKTVRPHERFLLGGPHLGALSH